MEQRILLFAVLFSTTAALAQQDHQLGPVGTSRGFIPVDLGMGQTMYAIDRNFGFDSSYVVLARTNAAMTIEELRVHRLHLPLSFLNVFTGLDDGYLLGGANIGFSNYPFLLKTDFIGSVEWYVSPTNLDHGQDQISTVFTSGTDLTCYTYPGGAFRDGVYRLQGDATQGILSGVEIATVASTRFRVYSGVESGTPGSQLLSGAGYMNDSSTTKNVLLMKVGTAGVDWMKFYDVGSVGNQLEDGLEVIALADGNHLVVGTYTAMGSLDAFAMKVDGQGTVLWARRYVSDGETLLFGGAHELPDGRLLVTGTGAGYSGILVLLEADGTQQWVKRYEAGGAPAGYGLSRPRPAHPNGYWVQARDRQLYIDDQLEGCDFSDLPLYTSASFTPTVTIPTWTNTSFAPNTIALQHYGRTHVPEWTPVCTPIGLPEQERSVGPALHPNPTDGPLFLTGTEVRTGEPLVVRDQLGRRVLTASWHGALDMGALGSGAYILELPEQGLRLRFVKR